MIAICYGNFMSKESFKNIKYRSTEKQFTGDFSEWRNQNSKVKMLLCAQKCHSKLNHNQLVKLNHNTTPKQTFHPK